MAVFLTLLPLLGIGLDYIMLLMCDIIDKSREIIEKPIPQLTIGDILYSGMLIVWSIFIFQFLAGLYEAFSDKNESMFGKIINWFLYDEDKKEEII